MTCGMCGFSVSVKKSNINQFKINFTHEAIYSAENVDEKDQSELYALSDEIVDFVSEIFISENIDINVRDNIRFLDIMKCYDDTDILQLNTSDEKKI